MAGKSKFYWEFSDLLKRYLEREHPNHGRNEWLAQHLSMSRNAVRRWLKEDTRPGKPETVLHIARILKLNREECEKLLDASKHPTTLEKQKGILLPKQTLDEDETLLLTYLRGIMPDSEAMKPLTAPSATLDERRLAVLIEAAVDEKIKIEQPNIDTVPQTEERAEESTRLPSDDEHGNTKIEPSRNQPLDNNVATIKITIKKNFAISHAEIYFDSKMVSSISGIDLNLGVFA